MITGDNPLTAAVIAKEAGVDDFLAEATPEAKMDLIRSEQQQASWCHDGDGTNDAPALAQATWRGDELGHLGRQRGRQHGRPRLQPHQAHRDRGHRQAAADHARSTHDLQHRQRRGKYFAIIPAMFMVSFPQMHSLNVMGLHSPHSAVLAAVIFNAIIIVMLIRWRCAA